MSRKICSCPFLLLLDTMSRSGKENYDVLGRELVLEYELRLLPDDECIIFCAWGKSNPG